jgi:hypothetical protein
LTSTTKRVLKTVIEGILLTHEAQTLGCVNAVAWSGRRNQ